MFIDTNISIYHSIVLNFISLLEARSMIRGLAGIDLLNISRIKTTERLTRQFSEQTSLY